MDIKGIAEKGENLSSLLIIDFHSHMGKWYCVPLYGDPSAKGMVRLMDKIGISKAVTSGMACFDPDIELGNEIILKAITDYPGRMVGVCTVNPHFLKQAGHELELRFKQGFVGVKIHPCTHAYKVTGQNYNIVWDFCQQHKTFVLSHTWLDGVCSPSMFEEAARTHPDAKFIMGHAGGSYDGQEEAVQIANKYDNIYLEICGTECSNNWLEKLVSRVDKDRILYGTDFPFLDPRINLGRVLYADFSDEIKQKILGLNAQRLLKEIGVKVC